MLVAIAIIESKCDRKRFVEIFDGIVRQCDEIKIKKFQLV